MLDAAGEDETAVGGALAPPPDVAPSAIPSFWNTMSISSAQFRSKSFWKKPRSGGGRKFLVCIETRFPFWMFSGVCISAGEEPKYRSLTPCRSPAGGVPTITGMMALPCLAASQISLRHASDWKYWALRNATKTFASGSLPKKFSCQSPPVTFCFPL